MKDRAALILFLRYPERGAVKTRLARDIGADRAFELYLCFLEDLMDAARGVDAELMVAGSGALSPGFADLFAGCAHFGQRGADLGDRINNAFTDVFSHGFSPALLVGSDIPGISAGIMGRAFELLDGHDCVIGPSGDGGFNLIALKSETPRSGLFRGISWSTPRVMAEIIKRTEEAGMSMSLLPELDDIDDLAGLVRFAESGIGFAAATRRYIEENRGDLFGRR